MASRFDCSASSLTVATISPIFCVFSLSSRMLRAMVETRSRSVVMPSMVSSTASARISYERCACSVVPITVCARSDGLLGGLPELLRGRR